MKNSIYMKNFLISLHKKLKAPADANLLPQNINIGDYSEIKSFIDFDERVTAPLHGYKNALDYWTQCSSKQYLNNIKIPTLIINAKNDTFLGSKCYPYDIARKSKYVSLETPQSGGHVGFVTFNKENLYWSEKRAFEFLKEVMS